MKEVTGKGKGSKPTPLSKRADSIDKLNRLIFEFGKECDSSKLKINMGKCRVVRYIS